MARYAIEAPERESVRGGLLSVARVADAPKEALYLGVKRIIGDDTPPVPIPVEGEEKDFAIYEDASGRLSTRLLYPFSVVLSSERKLQSVPFSMIVCGVDWIMPISWSRRA